MTWSRFEIDRMMRALSQGCEGTDDPGTEFFGVVEQSCGGMVFPREGEG